MNLAFLLISSTQNVFTNMFYKCSKKVCNFIYDTMGKKCRILIIFGWVMFVGPLSLFSVEAQQIRISLKVNNASLVQVLEDIRKQSGYNFMYNEKYVKGFGGLTLDIRNLPLEEAMQEVLKQTKLVYKIQDNIIILQEGRLQQEHFRKVKGLVKDEKGEPLPGVTVLIKGTTTGVSTGLQGEFSLEVPLGTKMLQVSFIGMETQEVKLTEDLNELSIVMHPHVSELEEATVISTGYTQVSQRRASGSVAVVDKKVFTNKALPTMDKLLQGQVAGVNVMARSGRPGESAKIRIRGTNTITGDAEPLWVVDGVPLQKNIPAITTGQIKSGDFSDIFTNGISGINPNDIENITILKDAAAAAIYGSRATGGVIVVTTKTGKAGKMSVNYSVNVSMVMKPGRDPGLMNSREKLAWEQELWDEFSAGRYATGERYPIVGIVGIIRSGKEEFAGMSSAEREAYIQDLGAYSTDWIGQLFRTAVSTNHYLSVSGGQEKCTYYMSLGYSKDNGAVRKTDYDRYNMSGKIDANPNERFHLQLGFDLAKQRSTGPSADPFSYAYFANPYERPYNEDGSYRADYTYYKLARVNGNFDPNIPPNGFNILREINETESKADNISTTARLNVDYTFFKQLKFSGLGSYSFTNNKSDNYKGKDTYAAYTDRLYFDSQSLVSKRTYSSISQSSANNSSYSLRGQLSYSDIYLQKHRLSVVAGAEIRGEKAESIYEKRYGYDPVTGNSAMPVPPEPADGSGLSYSEIVSYANAMDNLSGQEIEENRMASFYGALDYSLLDKYVFNMSFRTDGSNNFGSDEQFNPTWSTGVVWHISDEAFMYGLQPVLSRLSLRVAMGYTGNINKTVKPNLMMTYYKDFRISDEENYRMGWIKSAPNPKLRWEKTRDIKVAVDFGLWGERISGLVEAYWRRNIDNVTSEYVPVTTGFVSQAYNTSEMENNGIEASLSVAVLKNRDYSLTISANMAWNRNKLLKYNSPNTTLAQDKYVGYPLGAIFSGKYEGIDPATGLYSFRLRPDAVINKDEDQSNANNYYFYLGTRNAPITGGFNLNFSYKGVGMSIGGSYSLHAKIVDNIDSPVGYTEAGSGKTESVPTPHNDLYVNHLNVRKEMRDRWTPMRTTGVKYPRLIDAFGERLGYDLDHPSASTITNGALIENISYLRVNNVSLYYNLPEKLLKQMRLSSLGMNIALNNFFTITKYSGIDPEVPGATYPVSRSVTVGLSIGF